MNGEIWLRFLFMLLFMPLLGCISVMILCVALFQFFAMLASGESDPQLRALGRGLSRFGVDIADFLTCNTERKPFPFAPDPLLHGELSRAPQREAGAGGESTPRRARHM